MKTFLKAAALLLATASVPSLANAQACGGQVELWFLNDESGSVTGDENTVGSEFYDSKEFLKSVSSNFTFDSQTGFQGSLIAWDAAPTLVYGLGGGFPTAVNTYARAGSGSTFPGAAMAYAQGALTNYGGSAYSTDGGAAARTGVPSIVVMLTDANGSSGKSGAVSDGPALTTAAQAIRDAGHQIVIMLANEAATEYGTDASFKSLMDGAAGSAANVIVGATYAEIADPTNGYISALTSKICAVATDLPQTPVFTNT